jgi:hypothetical protein
VTCILEHGTVYFDRNLPVPENPAFAATHPDNRGRKILRKVGRIASDYTASPFSRQKSLVTAVRT